MRQMKVDKLGIDLHTHDPVVILRDLEGKRYLPILIGPFEATAIALALEGTAVPRPLSHDLMRTCSSRSRRGSSRSSFTTSRTRRSSPS